MSLIGNVSKVGEVLYYKADVKAAYYYSAYGAISNKYGSDPVVAFNGQHKSGEIGVDAQTALYWEYNGDVGRRWNVDPRPSIGFSSYMVFMNNPLLFSDIKGDSIDPQRKTPVNVFIVPKTRDKATKLDFARLSNTKDAKFKTVIIETNTLDKKVAERIKKALGG